MIIQKKKKESIKKKIFTYLLATSLTLLPINIKSEETYIPKKLFRYNPISQNLFCNDPFWTYKIENVCDTEFSKYINKNNETVPVLFVAYKDGRAGVFILPMKEEKKLLYYEFERRFEVREDNTCYIFEGEDEKDGKKFLYFRVIDKNGKPMNYGIPYGMF